MKTKPQIANYELNNYTYEAFWASRKYEDWAERLALRSILRNVTGNWMIDIGGSYGRLLNEYSSKYQQIIILDYSAPDLQQAIDKAKQLGLKVHLVAANAYHLPFANNSLDGGICVRVLHHIEKPQVFFKELNRVLKPGATFVLEFANKFNLKAIVRNVVHRNWSYFSPKPYLVPHRTDSQGIMGDQYSIIYNFSFVNIKQLLKRSKLIINKKINVSWLRIWWLKKILPWSVLQSLEWFGQTFFSWTNLTPSIIMSVCKPSFSQKRPHLENLKDLLIDPLTKKKPRLANIDFAERKNVKKYAKLTTEDGDIIWDLRSPRPETIDY